MARSLLPSESSPPSSPSQPIRRHSRPQRTAQGWRHRPSLRPLRMAHKHKWLRRARQLPETSCECYDNNCSSLIGNSLTPNNSCEMDQWHSIRVQRVTEDYTNSSYRSASNSWLRSYRLTDACG